MDVTFERVRVVGQQSGVSRSSGLPQSGMGITSFAIAVLGCFSQAILIIVCLSSRDSAGQGGHQVTTQEYLIGLWQCGTMVLFLCGIVFGIGGMRQRGHRQHVAMIGLVANILVPAGVSFLLLIAFIFKNREEHAQGAGGTDHVAWSMTPTRLAVVAMWGVLAVYCARKPLRRIWVRGTICGRCRKQLPRSARYCRRCGNVMMGGDGAPGMPGG